MAGSAADLSGMLTGIANTVGDMGKPASQLFQNLGAPLPDPNDPESLNEYAVWLQKMGRGQEAMQYMQQARATQAMKQAELSGRRKEAEFVDQQQNKSIAQTYYDPNLKGDERGQWLDAMKAAGKGEVILGLQQRDEQIKRAEEQHAWASVNQQNTEQMAAKKEAADNITKAWFQASAQGDDALEALVKKATESGHGDVIFDLKARQVQYNSMLESNKTAIESGQKLDRSFFKEDTDYATYEKQYDAAPRTANDRAIAQHRMLFQAETAKSMGGDDRLAKWEDEMITKHLDELDNVAARWWPEVWGGRPVEGMDSDRLHEVKEEAKRIYKEEGKLIDKEEYLKLMKEKSDAFENPEPKKEEWGIAN